MASQLICFFVLWMTISGVFGETLSGWKDCGSEMDITGVRISGCTKLPCTMYKGQQYTFAVDGVSASTSSVLPYTVKAKHASYPSGLTILEGDACKELTRGECPLAKSGEPFTFGSTFVLEPPVQTKGKFQVTVNLNAVDDAGHQIICLELDVIVKTKPLAASAIPPKAPTPRKEL